LIAALLFCSPILAGEIPGRVCEPADCCTCVSFEYLPLATADASPDAQTMQHGTAHSMAGMDMSHPESLIDTILMHASSGTSVEPASTPHDMLMKHLGAWMLMFHGVAFANSQQQTGPRGGDKVFGTSWFMPMVQRSLGPGTFTGRVMLSLDPATITNRRYPELFQVGETAYGNPIVDGQHPHDFFMELALLYDLKLGENTLLSFYGAPVGDPAMGPTAFAHRTSASEDDLAPLGHHLQDSTHIANDVVTVGLTYKIARIEASGFHGREPDEFRWNIDAAEKPRAAFPDGRHATYDGVGYLPPAISEWKLGDAVALGTQSRHSRRAGVQQLSRGKHSAVRKTQLRVDAHRKRGSHERSSARGKPFAARIRREVSCADTGLHIRLRSRIQFHPARIERVGRAIHAVHEAVFSESHLWKQYDGRASLRPLPRDSFGEVEIA
jgi:hypothetical protein